MRDNNVIDIYSYAQDRKYIVPYLVLNGRQELPKNSRKLLALILLHTKNIRDRLYEVDKAGKEAENKLKSAAEKKKHFNSYVPVWDEFNKVSATVLFTWEHLDTLFDWSESKKRTIESAKHGLMSKIFHWTEDEKMKSGVLVPYAEVGDDGIEIDLTRKVWIKLFDHVNGFSVTELYLWLKLKSQYSQKLLELVSEDKERINNKVYSIEELKFYLGCDYKTYTHQHILDAKNAGMNTPILGAYILEDGKKVPMYKTFADFRRRVLDVAFQDLINASEGIISATDEGGLGYKLHRSGRSISKLSFCLKYNKDKIKELKNGTVKSTDKKTNYDIKSVRDAGSVAKSIGMCVDIINKFDPTAFHKNKDYSKYISDAIKIFDGLSLLADNIKQSDVFYKKLKDIKTLM